MSEETVAQPASVTSAKRLGQELRARRRFDLVKRFARNNLAVVGLIFVAIIVAIAIAAPVIATHSPTEQSLFRRLQGPSSEHYFGTDELGRDVFSRVVHGSRYSLFIGVSGAIGGLILGLTLGMLSGYFGTWVDQVIMRVIDVMLSFPGVLMAILIVSVLGPGIYNLIVALTIWFTPTIARLIRGAVLALKSQEFVLAAHAIGASNPRIMVRHLLPISLSPLIVYGTLSVAVALLVAAGLSFLGLGAQPPTPEWGAMIGSGRQYLRDAPNATLFPGLAIFFTVLSLNFIGDALRDALDPRLRSEGRMSQ
jgi:peptide/nickel transport system permease protein